MSFLALGLALALFVYGAFMGFTCLAVLPWLRSAARLPSPRLRARRLAMLRLLPGAVGAIVVFGLFFPAFFGNEPRHTEESVSGTLLALAALTAAVAAAGFLKGTLSLLSTRRLVRRWSETATPLEGLYGIDVPVFEVKASFPVASLVGFVRPRIFLARSVLDRCDERELSAVIAHELGHFEHRDPWMRLLLRSCPDALSLTSWSERVEKAWAEAAEQRADDAASRRVPAVHLASALVKVARLVASTPPRELLFPALYQGEGVSHRVSRLLERKDGEAADRDGAVRPAWLAPFALAFVPVVSVAAFGLLPRVHDLVESLVRLLQ